MDIDKEVCQYCHRPHHGVNMCADVTAQYKKEEEEFQKKKVAEATRTVKPQKLPFTLR